MGTRLAGKGRPSHPALAKGDIGRAIAIGLSRGVRGAVVVMPKLRNRRHMARKTFRLIAGRKAARRSFRQIDIGRPWTPLDALAAEGPPRRLWPARGLMAQTARRPRPFRSIEEMDT